MNIKKELLIYFAIIVIVAIVQHPDFLTAPIDRVSKLPSSVVYGMGPFHPLGFGLIGYAVIGILRLIIAGTKKVFRRS